MSSCQCVFKPYLIQATNVVYLKKQNLLVLLFYWMKIAFFSLDYAIKELKLFNIMYKGWVIYIMLNEIDRFTLGYNCEKLNNANLVTRLGFNQGTGALIYRIQ